MSRKLKHLHFNQNNNKNKIKAIKVRKEIFKIQREIFNQKFHQLESLKIMMMIIQKIHNLAGIGNYMLF